MDWTNIETRALTKNPCYNHHAFLSPLEDFQQAPFLHSTTPNSQNQKEPACVHCSLQASIPSPCRETCSSWKPTPYFLITGIVLGHLWVPWLQYMDAIILLLLPPDPIHQCSCWWSSNLRIFRDPLTSSHLTAMHHHHAELTLPSLGFCTWNSSFLIPPSLCSILLQPLLLLKQLSVSALSPSNQAILCSPVTQNLHRSPLFLIPCVMLSHCTTPDTLSALSCFSLTVLNCGKLPSALSICPKYEIQLVDFIKTCLVF